MNYAAATTMDMANAPADAAATEAAEEEGWCDNLSVSPIALACGSSSQIVEPDQPKIPTPDAKELRAANCVLRSRLRALLPTAGNVVATL